MRRVALLALVGLLAGCGGATHETRFVRGVNNPWFPLKSGTTFEYVGHKDGERGRDVVTVTHQTKRIRGVDCVAVEDRLYAASNLAERTTDWYAEDARGNVWYFGEATAELDETGRITSREGSWLAGVYGVRAGIFMPAHPKVGTSFRQEYYKGHAEDHFKVLSLSENVITRTPRHRGHC